MMDPLDEAALIVEDRADCVLCTFFDRKPRTKPVMMAVLRMQGFPGAKGLAICRDCWRNGASMLKKARKK